MSDIHPWRLHSAEGRAMDFLPLFEVTENGQDVECKGIQITTPDDHKKYTFNFINLYQFIYFISSEELRRGLALRYQRRVNRIPYEVSFKLDPDEIQSGMAKRRIEIPIDELSMAIARNEAWKMMPLVNSQISTGTKPPELFKNKGRNGIIKP